MAEILDAALVRSGTWGQLWLDGELVAECYGCQIKLNKTKEDVARCRTLVAGKKMTAIAGTGTVRIYNATSRLIQAEGQALKNGQDLRHTLISNLEDPGDLRRLVRRPDAGGLGGRPTGTDRGTVYF